MNTKLALAALATLALSVPAFADEPSAKAETNYHATDNGGYKKSDTDVSTDANGTTVKHDTTKKVDVDSNGDTTTTVDIKDKTSPKGIFSKSSTTEVKNKSVKKNGKTEVEHTKKVNGTTVENNDDMSKSQ